MPKRVPASSKTGFELIPDEPTPPNLLRQWMSNQFGTRFQSTGDAADVAQTRKLVEIVDASETNPYLVFFDQFVLTAFTGPGQFDLVETDPDGGNPVTLSDKSGFTDGDTTGLWSRFAKLITANKIYKVVFVPGTAGDGVYSLNLCGLRQGQQ